MAKVFISHSSKDSHFVRKLADDLKALGHTVWFDEHDIKVGEVIPSKIERGLADADYVVVVLSKNSIESGWVDREVKAKLWDEINKGSVMVLPVLLEQCDIPPFLKIKKYANFTANYSVGLAQLASGMMPPTNIPSQEIQHLPRPQPFTPKVAALLEKIEGRKQPLGQSITEALAIAREAKNEALERFCRNEISGWSEEIADKAGLPEYRTIEAFLSPEQINMGYVGWGQSAANVFAYMQRNPKLYAPYRMFIPHPISRIEREAAQPMPPNGGLMTFTLQAGKVMDVSPDLAAFPIFGYARADSYLDLLDTIRGELVRRLLDLLPTVEATR